MGGASAPGVTHTPITSKTTTITYKPKRIRNQRRFQDDLNVVKEYQQTQESITRRKEEPKSKPPVWKRILGSKPAKVAGKALQYTSLSEAATKIPGIGDEIEAGLDYVPGVREALAAGTNLPAWALAVPTGGGSLAATAAAVGAGSAGAGLGAWALSDDKRGLGLDIAGVPEKYERMVGSLVGGIGGAGIASKATQARAISAATNAEQNIKRMESGVLQADDVLYTPDFQTYTARRPTIDLPDKPITWHDVRVKDAGLFQHNADDMSYRLLPEEEATVRSSILNANREQVGNLRDAQIDNAAFDFAGAPAKPASTGFLRNIANMAENVADVSLPGWRTISKLDKGVGRAIGSLAPKPLEGIASTLARPSMLTAGAALMNPSEAKELVRKGLEIDHKIGLNIAQAILPQWELDVNVPDWLPGGDFTVDLEGVGAELFRPTNLINFTPAGTAVKAGMVLKSGARLAGAKALGEIAVREGAGNAVIGGLDAWSRGADKDGILQAMGISFAAGAGLGVPLNVAMPLAQHHIRGMVDIVNRAPNEDEAAKGLMTMQKNLEADYSETLPVEEPSLEDRVSLALREEPKEPDAIFDAREEPVAEGGTITDAYEPTSSLIRRLNELDADGSMYRTYNEVDDAATEPDRIALYREEHQSLFDELMNRYEQGDLEAKQYLENERYNDLAANRERVDRTPGENPVTPEDLAFGTTDDRSVFVEQRTPGELREVQPSQIGIDRTDPTQMTNRDLYETATKAENRAARAAEQIDWGAQDLTPEQRARYEAQENLFSGEAERLSAEIARRRALGEWPIWEDLESFNEWDTKLKTFLAEQGDNVPGRSVGDNIPPQGMRPAVEQRTPGELREFTPEEAQTSDTADARALNNLDMLKAQITNAARQYGSDSPEYRRAVDNFRFEQEAFLASKGDRIPPQGMRPADNLETQTLINHWWDAQAKADQWETELTTRPEAPENLHRQAAEKRQEAEVLRSTLERRAQAGDEEAQNALSDYALEGEIKSLSTEDLAAKFESELRAVPSVLERDLAAMQKENATGKYPNAEAQARDALAFEDVVDRLEGIEDPSVKYRLTEMWYALQIRAEHGDDVAANFVESVQRSEPDVPRRPDPLRGLFTSRENANVEQVAPFPINEVNDNIMVGQANVGELPRNKAFWVTPEGKVYSPVTGRGTHPEILHTLAEQRPKTGAAKDDLFRTARDAGWVRGYLDNEGISLEGNNIDDLRRVAGLVENPDTPVYFDVANEFEDLSRGSLKENAKLSTSLKALKEEGVDLYEGAGEELTAGQSTVGEFTSGIRSTVTEPDTLPMDQALMRRAQQERPGSEIVGNYVVDEVPEDIRGNVERWYRHGANREPMSEEDFNAWFENVMRATAKPAPRAVPNYKQSGDLVADVQVQSMRRIASLFEDTVEDTYYGIGATEPHYKPITEQMAKEVFIKEYVELTGRHIGELPALLRKAGVLPDDWNEFSYGGILVDRITSPDEPMTSVSGVYLVTPGDKGQVGMGDGIIATDPSSIASAVTYKLRRPMEADDLGHIFRIFGDQAKFSEVLAYFMVANNFHEAVHRVILGHAKNFTSVLDKIRQTGAAEFDAMVRETAEMTNRWSQDGSLQKLGDYTSEILGLQEQYYNAARAGGESGRVAAANIQRTGAGNGIGEAGDVGDSGVRGSTGEGRPELEGNLSEPTAGQAGEGLDAGAGGSGDRGGTGSGTGLAGDVEPGDDGSPIRRVNDAGEPAVEPSDTPQRPPDVEAPIGSAAFDVVSSFKLADDNVHVSRAGTGWDLYLAGAKGKDRLVKELPTVKDYMETELTDDTMRKFGQNLAKSKVGRFIAETLAGKAATAKQQFEKAVVGYRMLLEAQEGRKFSTMNWLRQSKPPFEEVYDATGKTHRMRVQTAEGDTVLVNVDDVFSNPSKYNLNADQKAYIQTGHRIIDELVDEMKRNGVDIKELGIEKRGEHYWPRFVEGKDGFTLEDVYGYDKQYGKKQVGAKQIFQKTRRHGSVAEGEAAGNVYAHPIKALEGFVDAANKTIASKQLMDALEGYGVSPKDLVFRDVGSVEINALADRHARAVDYLNDLMEDPEKNAAKIVTAQEAVNKLQRQLDYTGGGTIKKIYKPLYAKLAELKKVEAEGRQLKRELAAAKRNAKGAQGGSNRKLSMRELTSFANEDPEVKRLRSALEDAKKRKLTGKEQVSPDEAKKEARFKKALHDYEQLRRNFSKYKNEGITFTQDAKPVITRIDKEGKVVPSQTAKKAEGNITKEQVDAAYKEMVAARKELGADNVVAIGQQLKEALATARKEQRLGHEVGRQGEIQSKRQTVEQVESKIKDWKIKHQNALADSRRVMGEMRSRLDRAKNLQTLDVEAFAAANDILPFEKDGKVAVRMLRNMPGLNNKWFPSDVAKIIEEVANDQGFRGLEKISSINDWARLARTSTDFGFLFIQGLPILMRHPHAFAKAMSQSLQAFKDPESYARWFASKSDIVDEATPYIGSFSNSDYFTAARGSRIAELARKKVTSPTAAAQKAAGVGIQRFAVSFDAFLDAAKISMWEGMSPHLKTPKEKAAFGRLIRNMTGTTSTTRLGVGAGQRQIEALLMFSPRFTRSVFALSAQAAQGDKAAIASIASLLGGAALAYTGAKYAMTGEMPTAEDFDPRNGGRFMSVKVGDNYIGLGGSMRGALQLLGYSLAATRDPERFLSTDSTSNDKSNPFLKYARGRLSPVAGQAYDVLAGETFIGEDTTDRKAWLARTPDMFLPFAAQAWVETEGGTDQKLMTLAAQSGGFRSFPESPNEDLDALINEKIPGVGRWSDLTSFQQAQFIEENPDARKLLDEKDIANWNQYKEINLQAQQAKKALGERWLRTQTQSNGEKVYPNDLTSKEYKEEIARINDQLSAARAVLSGGDPFTGLGGEFNRNANTPRQKLMKAYYEYVSKDKYTRPDGTIDYDVRQSLEDRFMASLDPEDQAIVDEETTGSMVDPVEARLKTSRKQLSEYFEISDAVAQSMGYESELAIQTAPEAVQKRYNKLETARKEQWRRMNPEADRLLAIWGYTSKLITEREAKGASNPVEKSVNRVIKRIKS